MRKNLTFGFYCLAILMCYFFSSCHTSHLSHTSSQPATGDANLIAESGLKEEQLLATIPDASNQDQAAAAATRPKINLNATVPAIPQNADFKNPATGSGKADRQGAISVQNKLSAPARILMKSLSKKVEKVQKKDIQGTAQEKAVNNKTYLILGIVLLLAGLILVLVGNTTLLYILGSVASLAGLVFLLLAIL